MNKNSKEDFKFLHDAALEWGDEQEEWHHPGCSALEDGNGSPKSLSQWENSPGWELSSRNSTSSSPASHQTSSPH